MANAFGEIGAEVEGESDAAPQVAVAADGASPRPFVESEPRAPEPVTAAAAGAPVYFWNNVAYVSSALVSVYGQHYETPKIRHVRLVRKSRRQLYLVLATGSIVVGGGLMLAGGATAGILGFFALLLGIIIGVIAVFEKTSHELVLDVNMVPFIVQLGHDGNWVAQLVAAIEAARKGSSPPDQVQFGARFQSVAQAGVPLVSDWGTPLWNPAWPYVGYRVPRPSPWPLRVFMAASAVGMLCGLFWIGKHGLYLGLFLAQLRFLMAFVVIMAVVPALWWIDRAWKAVPPECRITSSNDIVDANDVAWKLLIPIYNIYWYFVATVGLADAMNLTLEAYDSPRRVNGRLALAGCICSLIPGPGIFAPVLFFLFMRDCEAAQIEMLGRLAGGPPPYALGYRRFDPRTGAPLQAPPLRQAGAPSYGPNAGWADPSPMQHVRSFLFYKKVAAAITLGVIILFITAGSTLLRWTMPTRPKAEATYAFDVAQAMKDGEALGAALASCANADPGAKVPQEMSSCAEATPHLAKLQATKEARLFWVPSPTRQSALLTVVSNHPYAVVLQREIECGTATSERAACVMRRPH